LPQLPEEPGILMLQLMSADGEILDGGYDEPAILRS
jgi:hypothetical protein